MISPARGILKRLNDFINIDDMDFILTLEIFSLEIKDISNSLERIFDGDNKLLKHKSSLKGLNSRYCRLEKDVAYRIGQAFLRADEIRQNRNEQFICIVARSIICRKVALSHLNKMDRLIAGLGHSAEILKIKPLQPEVIKECLKIGHNVDEIKGYGREVYLIVDDYCHFYDLANHLLGDKAHLYGSRFKADVYSFQLASAIRGLFTSRTESCDAAPFLIRSHLELKIRRLIFDRDFMKPTQYLPSKNLTISKLLKSCQRNGIHFNYSNEILELLLQNLNIVVHFGFKLSSALLWYTFYVTNSLQVKLDNSISTKKPKEALKKYVTNVFSDLERSGLVQKAGESEFFKKRGINIFWRY